jgi:translation initiation factor 5A
MSDDEGGQHEVEAKDGCKPMQASAFRKGTCIVLKDKPCKVVDMSTSKTGKHGHAKVNFTGVDIFTGKKYKEIQGSTHNMLTFDAVKQDHMVMSIENDQLSLIDDDGGTTEIDLPEDEDMASKIKDAVAQEGKETYVTVLTALNQSQVVAFNIKDIKE